MLMKMCVIRKARKYLYSNSVFLRRYWFLFLFFRDNKYIPNFKKPRTYNEKINFRKKNPKNFLFSICADKIKAKEYVAEKISSNIVIPNYYVGESITFEQMKSIIYEKGDCLLKANHNSGPVHLLTTKSTDEEIKKAVESTLDQLKEDYGKQANEPWYSEIKRRVLVEKRLDPEPGESDIRDYKFHVFKQKNNTFKVILCVYFERGENTTASYFDEELNWLPFHGQFPSVVTKIKTPKNYSDMLEYAKKLCDDFSYVRVDFYNVGGSIYFGELTFAHASGNSKFSDISYDLWMGNLWQGNPSY